MGMQNGEEYMDNIGASLAQQYLRYKDIISEYCNLTSRVTLTESQAERIEEILLEAQSDMMLEFFLDEADHIVAHQLNLIKPKIIEQQQDKLSTYLEEIWSKEFIKEIPNQLTQLHRKKLQECLKQKGLYTGLIDGIFGSKTRKALECLKHKENINPEEDQLIELCNINN
jgi:hypothetical protein